ncbi:glucose-6-phosphate dehydrogenase [Phlyctochytrium arcticum]|nr:glucose-6-phosphate dehydrogenase [Phlyctochytrium arcticum]
MSDSVPYSHVTIAVFGASGDLAKKMTYPALYSLFANNRVPRDQTHFVGVARSKLEKDAFRKKITSNIKDADQKVLDQFLEKAPYVSLESYDDEQSYKNLDAEISKLEKKAGSGKGKTLRLFYVALPPSAFEDVARCLKKFAWHDDHVNRVIIEKPYGKDYQSAKELSKVLASQFEENDIYRIDHFLGKDGLRSLLPLRFGGNPVFSTTFSREHIKAVTICLKEPFGAEGRGGYFDEYGMIRDVMQNHLLQWVILLGMERPKSLQAQDIQKAKLQFIRDCKPIQPEDVLVAQYTASSKDPELKAYKDDETVKKGSKANTHAVAVMYVNNDRWRDVPFVFRCGKALEEKRSEVTIHYKPPSDTLFTVGTAPTFTISESPTLSHTLTAITKQPGTGFTTINVPLSGDLKAAKTKAAELAHKPVDKYLPTAYETMIMDAVMGDRTWFIPQEEAEEAWHIFDHAIAESEKREPLEYEYGSTAPKEEKAFLDKYGVSFETGTYATRDASKELSHASAPVRA